MIMREMRCPNLALLSRNAWASRIQNAKLDDDHHCPPLIHQFGLIYILLPMKKYTALIQFQGAAVASSISTCVLILCHSHSEFWYSYSCWWKFKSEPYYCSLQVQLVLPLPGQLIFPHFTSSFLLPIKWVSRKPVSPITHIYYRRPIKPFTSPLYSFYWRDLHGRKWWPWWN